MDVARELAEVRLLLAAEKDHEKALDSTVKKLGAIQQEKVKLLDSTGDKVRKLGTKESVEEGALYAYLRKNPDSADAMYELMKKYRIITGDLGNRFVDEVEYRVRDSLWPSPWPVTRADWAIVSA